MSQKKNQPSSVQSFIKESGFKILAMSRLSQCEYSTVLYLLNAATSGLDHLITTDTEFASLIGYSDKDTRAAIASLVGKEMIRVHYGDLSQKPDSQSMRIGMQFDLSKWRLDTDKDKKTAGVKSSQDAVVFPFRRLGNANLQVVEGERSVKHDKLRLSSVQPEEERTWQRVLESFVRGDNYSEEDLKTAEQAARTLVDTHPVDQVLLMLRHFGDRIPTLSLLASSWQHYQELFEEEVQKVDLLGARQKHLELDRKIREKAEQALEEAEPKSLTEEEMTVLQILAKHRHPRRQLFWAYQLRSRYPGLNKFFEKNADLMLPVTTSGNAVKRPPAE